MVRLDLHGHHGWARALARPWNHVHQGIKHKLLTTSEKVMYTYHTKLAGLVSNKATAAEEKPSSMEMRPTNVLCYPQTFLVHR